MELLWNNLSTYWFFYAPLCAAACALTLPALPGLWGQRGQAAAIALLTLRESLRKKALFAALAAGLLILASTPFLSALNEPGDKLKVVQTVCVLALNVFGCLAAVMLGAFALPVDIEQKTIYSVVTKPVTREALIVGKIAGQAAVIALSLVLVAAASWIAVQHAAMQEPDPVTARRLLSGRRFLRADRMTVLGQSKKRPEFGEKYVWVGGTEGVVEWMFNNLNEQPMPEPVVEAELRGLVSARDPAKRSIPLLITVSNPATGESKDIAGVVLQDEKPVTFRFPSGLISSDGGLRVTAAPARRLEWLGVKPEGLALEAIPSPYFANFARAMTILACQFVLIVVVSVAGSTFLSAQVSAVFSVFVVFCGYINDFIRDLAAASQLIAPVGHVHAAAAVRPPGLGAIIANQALKEFLNLFSAVAPDFRQFAVGHYLVNGLCAPPAAVASAFVYMLFYALLALALARAVMMGKELA